MKDREGNKYKMLKRTEVTGKNPFSSALPAHTREVPICIISPARQFKKVSGRTGRQWTKYRKAQRHIAKYEQDTRNGRVW